MSNQSEKLVMDLEALVLANRERYKDRPFMDDDESSYNLGVEIMMDKVENCLNDYKKDLEYDELLTNLLDSIKMNKANYKQVAYLDSSEISYYNAVNEMMDDVETILRSNGI